MDVLLPIFQLLYFIVHFLFSLAQAVIDCFHELYHTIFNYLFWKKRFLPSSNQVIIDASQLKKIPQHIGFILASKQTNSFKHICHVINWSVGFGIHTISLYDADGILKLKLPSLLDNLFVCQDVILKVFVDDQIYIRANREEITESWDNFNHSKKEWSNGLRKLKCNSNLRTSLPKKLSNCNKQVISINILCIEDGKENIVNSAKVACNLKMKAVDAKLIESNLITKDQLDPDLVLIIGRPTCTVGFLPWQIRLTEFLCIPSINRLDYQELKKQLLLFSRCQQRCGS